MATEDKPHTTFPIHIERMRLADVGVVAELDTKCFPTPWSVAAYANEIRNTSAYYIVARHESRIVGYGGFWLVTDEAHITTLGVAPEHRRKKVGERILGHLLYEACRRGARRTTLEVRKSNKAAQDLYAKFGFRVVAVRKAYYTNNNEDALVMWLDDMQDAELLKSLQVSYSNTGINE